MKKTNNQIQEAIKYLSALVAFLLPVFFLPITPEKFAFNKLTLLIGATSAMLILWVIDVIKTKTLKIAKTPFNLPGILFLAVILISAIFSMDKTSSIFGVQGRWFPSLTALITLGAFYLILTSTITAKKDIKMILYSFVTGSTLAAITALVSYYGVELLTGSGPFFNTTGSLLTLGFLAAISSTIAIYELIKGENLGLKTFAGVVFFVNFAYVALYNKAVIWIFLGVGLAGLLATTKTEKIKEQKLPLIITGILATTILGLTLTPLTKPIFVRNTYPNPAQLNFSESWDIAISTMRDYPLIGTGPSTFYLNYPRYRSAAMNQTDYWNSRFDKPFNQALLVVGTLGIVGILAAAYLNIEIIKTAINNLKSGDKPEETKLKQLLALLSLLLLGSMLVTSTTALTGFTTVMVIGLFASTINLETQKYLVFSTAENSVNDSENALKSLTNASDENSAFLTVLMVLPFLALSGMGFLAIYKMYPSEYYMQKAVDLINTDAAKSFEYQAKAIRSNPNRSSYYNTYAQTNLAMAVNLSKKKELTDAEKQGFQDLVSTAIRATKISTETVNPWNPANWEVRSNVYKAIRGAAEDADTWAAQALEQAIQLDPNNPRLRVELGGLYFAREDYATAAGYFRQATNLKPDYANAYYNFAQAVKNLQNYASAKRALELTLSLLPQDSEDYAQVEKEIAELADLLATAEGAVEDKPTVEELERQAQIEEAAEEVTEQEPLTVEGEEEVVAPVDLDAVDEEVDSEAEEDAEVEETEEE
ncbi:hypothetical protein GF360_00145 [candidate division WWE3 bacterium]|nr:hypothetical protein [candidate division WWE3 bacterium]